MKAVARPYPLLSFSFIFATGKNVSRTATKARSHDKQSWASVTVAFLDRIRQRLPSNYGRQWADNEPNPQGWAFHNARRFHPSDAFEDSPTAKLPHLLALNPQAKRVFYNLNHHANPQYALAELSPRKTQVLT